MNHIKLAENQIVTDIDGNTYKTTKGDIVPINESVDTMTIGEFCNSVEQLYNKYFPKSLCNVWFDKQLGGSITIKCYLAKNEDEEDFHNFRNDMFNLGFMVYDFPRETTVDSLMPETFELEKIASSFLIKPEDTYHAFGSIKVPFKKITGDVNKVLFALNKHFDKFHDAVTQSYKDDLIHHSFIELVKEKL